MTQTTRNPSELPVPAAYSNGIEVSASARTLYVAGQIAIAADGSVPEGIEAQTRLAFENVGLVLKAAGMDFKDIAKSTIYMTNPDDYPTFGKIRTEILGDTKPASTLVYISGLVRPEFLVEIDVIAVSD